MKPIITCLIFFAIIMNVRAQELQPEGAFLQDTMRLAEPVQFSLSVEHDRTTNVLFPDSSFNYYPFEFISKQYFKTSSDSLKSKDSAVYTLSSFEIEALQALKLPVFVVNGADSVTVFTPSDDIVFAETITEAVDSVAAVKSTTFVTVEKQFNYPYLLIGLVILIVIAIVLVLVFGKKAMLNYRIYRLKQRQAKFLASFTDFSNIDDRNALEELLKRWKSHTEFISKKPYSKLTTKEIKNMLKDDALDENLQAIDKAIYSSRAKNSVINNLEYLKSYTEVIFNNRIIELKEHARN